jgi:hypothetical protein
MRAGDHGHTIQPGRPAEFRPRLQRIEHLQSMAVARQWWATLWDGQWRAGQRTLRSFTGAPDQIFNFGPANDMRRPDTRYVGGFFAHYAANKRFDAYASLMFSDDDTQAVVAPGGLFFGVGEVSGSAVEVNCSNPLMTAQERALICGANGLGSANIIPGQALLQIGRRDIEGDDRVSDLRHTAYRMQIGVKGDLGSGWTYDVYGQYGLTLYSQIFSGDFSIRRAQNALQVDPLTGKCFAAEQNASPSIFSTGSGPSRPPWMNTSLRKESSKASRRNRLSAGRWLAIWAHGAGGPPGRNRRSRRRWERSGGPKLWY